MKPILFKQFAAGASLRRFGTNFCRKFLARTSYKKLRSYKRLIARQSQPNMLELEFLSTLLSRLLSSLLYYADTTQTTRFPDREILGGFLDERKHSLTNCTLSELEIAPA